MKHSGKISLKFFVLFVLIIHFKISTINTISTFNIKNLSHSKINLNYSKSFKATSKNTSESLSENNIENSVTKVFKQDSFITSNQLKTTLPNRNQTINKGITIDTSPENFFYRKIHLKTNSRHLNKINNIESSYWEILLINNENGWTQTLNNFHIHPDFKYSFDTSNFSANSLSKLKITLTIPGIRWFLRSGKKNAHLYLRLLFDEVIVSTRQFEATKVNSNENLDGNDHGNKNNNVTLNGVVYNILPGLHKISVQFSSSLDMVVGLKPNNWPQLTLFGNYNKTESPNNTLLVPNEQWKRKINLPIAFYSLYKYRMYVNDSYFFFYTTWNDFTAEWQYLSHNNGTQVYWGVHDVLYAKVGIDDGDIIRLVNHSQNLMMASVTLNTNKNRFQYINTTYTYDNNFLTKKNKWHCGILYSWYTDINKAVYTNNNPDLRSIRYDRQSYPQARLVDHNAHLISSFNYGTGYNHVCRYEVDLKETEDKNEDLMMSFSFDGPNSSYNFFNYIYYKDQIFSYQSNSNYLGYLFNITKAQTKGYIKKGDKICVSINGNTVMYFIGIINYIETINGIEYYKTYKTGKLASNWKSEGVTPQISPLDYSTTKFWGGIWNFYQNFLYVNGARYNYINKADVKYCLDWSTIN